MPGLIEDFRVAFSGRRILTKHARLHQLLYFRNSLVLVDAKINSMDPDGTVDEAPALVTPVGNLDWPHPKAPQVRSVQGFRDAQGRRLSLHNEVNLHLRFLVNPALFKELVRAAAQSLTTRESGPSLFEYPAVNLHIGPKAPVKAHETGRLRTFHIHASIERPSILPLLIPRPSQQSIHQMQGGSLLSTRLGIKAKLINQGRTRMP
jgi:hypothetical protein